MSHTAEIIAVGTEILLGNIANTDAQMLSQSLSTLGVNVFWHTVVGDNPQRLREALDIARHRADIILTTPRHPATRPRLEDVRQAEAALDVESLVQKALADETWVRVKSTDPARI